MRSGFCFKSVFRRLVFLLVLLGSIRARAKADGARLSAACVACHGAQGISVSPLWPNLAGQQEKYLEIQLKAFRDGARKNPLMSPVAKTLSDEDIKVLAQYFSQLVK